MAVSSAKSLTFDLTCGTPEKTGMRLELIPLVTTDCFLLSKKNFI